MKLGPGTKLNGIRVHILPLQGNNFHGVNTVQTQSGDASRRIGVCTDVEGINT